MRTKHSAVANICENVSFAADISGKYNKTPMSNEFNSLLGRLRSLGLKLESTIDLRDLVPLFRACIVRNHGS